MLVTSGVLLAAGYDLMPMNFETLPMQVYSVPWLTRDFAWQSKDSYPNQYQRQMQNPNVRDWDRANAFGLGNIALYYDTIDGNIFTKANLKRIKTVEDGILAISGFSDYCQVEADGSCIKPFSILRYFDGTYGALDPIFNDANFDNIPGVLHAANTNNLLKKRFQYFLSKSHSITATGASAIITRSMVYIGMQNNLTSEELKDKVKTYTGETIKPVLEKLASSISAFDLVFYSQMMFVYSVLIEAMQDMMLAIGSVSFIFLFMLFHTRSLWITSWGVFSILTSFLGTNLIYRIVFDYRYLGFFHVLTIFIILGIGADDLFVFYDMWRNSASEKYKSLAHRLADVYRKSALSMLITSLTTMTAFFANGLSPLLATSSFGIFAGTLIVINYISVIIFFPTVVAIYHVQFESFEWPCCCCCNNRSTVSPNDTTKTKAFVIKVKPVVDNNEKVFMVKDKANTTDSNIQEIAMNAPSGKELKSLNNQAHTSNFNTDDVIVLGAQTSNKIDVSNQQTESGYTKDKSLMVVFFRDKYFRFVTHKVIRWFLLCIFLAVVIFFAYNASKLEPDDEDVSRSCYFA